MLKRRLIALLLAAGILSGCAAEPTQSNTEIKNASVSAIVATSAANTSSADSVSGTLKTWNSQDTIPDYAGNIYVEINGNTPYFSSSDLTEEPFETYSDLDSLGRCGVAYANICKELMPTEERGEIGMVKPSGWHTVKYPDTIKDLYLYNRCHLIAFCLAGENANEKNLVTGTRSLNVDGMLPFETKTAKYVESTGNHVLYRVTPIFIGSELVCRGVEMEALSVEDNGAGIKFHIFVYNVQPGIEIDYATGDSKEIGTAETTGASEATGAVTTTETKEYVLNTNSKKFHLPDCAGVEKMSEKNKEARTAAREDLINEGYSPCGICNP